MKKMIPVLLTAALLCCMTAALTACIGKTDPVTLPTGDLTSPVTTVKVTDEPEETTAAPERRFYTLDSEEGGFALTLEAASDAPLQIETGEDAGLPTLTVTDTETDAALTLRVELPQNKEILDGMEAQALSDGGEQIMLGSYGGHTVPTDGEAVVLLEKVPDADAWFTLRISAGRDRAIGDLLKDAALADFLSTMIFNINA